MVRQAHHERVFKIHMGFRGKIMRKYYDRFKGKVGSARSRMQDYWSRLMNHSKVKKLSEGSAEINKLITTAHKDQWRRNNKK